MEDDSLLEELIQTMRRLRIALSPLLRLFLDTLQEQKVVKMSKNKTP
jgi:hypothetical protein